MSIAHEWDLPSRALRGLSVRERRQFWDGFEVAAATPYEKGNGFSRWRAVPNTELNLALYVTNRSVGLFVRGLRGVPLSETRRLLGPHARRLEAALGAQLDDEVPLLLRLPLAMTDPNSWPAAWSWLREAEAEYLAVLAGVFRED
jgi:hypothetical protein